MKQWSLNLLDLTISHPARRWNMGFIPVCPKRWPFSKRCRGKSTYFTVGHGILMEFTLWWFHVTQQNDSKSQVFNSEVHFNSEVRWLETASLMIWMEDDGQKISIAFQVFWCFLPLATGFLLHPSPWVAVLDVSLLGSGRCSVCWDRGRKWRWTGDPCWHRSDSGCDWKCRWFLVGEGSNELFAYHCISLQISRTSLKPTEWFP